MTTISVIIPTFNREKTIKRAIESALNQTFSPLEVFVCDDGSTDKSRRIVEEIKDARVRWIEGKHSGLPAVTRNRGIKKSKGEWLAFLDSDDWWVKEKLEYQILTALKNKEIGMVCSNAFVNNTSKKYLRLKSDKFFSFEDLLEDNSIVTSTTVFKSSFIKKLGLFDENSKLVAFEDYEFWLRISANGGRIYFLSEPLINYSLNPKGLSRTLPKRIESYKKLKVYRALLNSKRVSNNLYKKMLLEKIRFFKRKVVLDNIKNKFGFVENLISKVII